MKELFHAWLTNPPPTTFDAIRAAVLAHSMYEPYSDELDQAATFMESENYEGATGCIAKAFPNLLLSPRAHMTLAIAARKQNRPEDERLERYIAHACIEGILGTGDGSHDLPFKVLRTSDEYDLLMSQGKEFKGQALIHDGDRHFDLVSNTDGSEYWFDITDPYERMRSRFEGPGSS